MPSPKEESERLTDGLLPFAEKMLTEHREFYPYGGYLTTDGKVACVAGTPEGTDHPQSSEIVDFLTKSFQKIAREGKCRATAIIIVVRVTPPGESEKTDAIQVCVDHREGYSAKIFFPYKTVNAELQFGSTFAVKGAGNIFVQ